MWVVCSNGWLWRFHPDGEGEGVASLDKRPRGIACDRDSVWILHANGDLVAIDQSTGETTVEARVRRGGRQLLYGNGALLALCRNGSTVCRVSPASGEAEAEQRLPARGIRATLHDCTLWVACGRRGQCSSAIVRLDPASGKTTPWAESEWTIYDLAVDGERLLATAGVVLAGPAAGMGGDGAAGAAPAHPGGHHGGGGHGGGH